MCFGGFSGRSNDMIYLDDNVEENEKINIEYDSAFHAKRHAHKYIEILYFEKGSGIHEISGQEHRVSNGDLYILDSRIEHSFNACDESKLLIVNIMFFSEFLGERINKDNFIAEAAERLIGTQIQMPHFLHLKGSSRQGYGAFIKDMMNEYIGKEQGYLKVLRNSLEVLLIRMFRDYEKSCAGKDLSITQKLCVEAAIETIESDLRNVDVNAIVKKSGYCKKYFNILFKRYTGKNIVEYIRQKRLEYAQKELRETQKSIEEICYDCGYNDVTHFYYNFKEFCQLTPNQYRKKTRGVEKTNI